MARKRVSAACTRRRAAAANCASRAINRVRTAARRWRGSNWSSARRSNSWRRVRPPMRPAMAWRRSAVSSAVCRPRKASRPGRPAKPGRASRAWRRDSRRRSRWSSADSRRSARPSMCPKNSSLRFTTSSAAAEGVAARRSATKSAMVTSVSWPTAEITGTGQAAMARTTASSLNAQRSSSDPPPRPTMTTSTPGTQATSVRARAMSAAAPSPCTRDGAITRCAFG